jgi:hypothetical protein
MQCSNAVCRVAASAGGHGHPHGPQPGCIVGRPCQVPVVPTRPRHCCAASRERGVPASRLISTSTAVLCGLEACNLLC